jgi:hypothetical protein
VTDFLIVQQIQGPPGATSLNVTGTGFVHVTTGTVDGAAKSVNLASNGAGGDVTGVLAVANGGTGLSAGGTNNQIAQWLGGIFTWAALNLATASLTNALPVANGGTGITTGGTNGQIATWAGGIFTWASSLPTAAFPALTGDVTTPGGSLVTTVVAISGASPIPITPNNLQWVSGATAPKISQAGNGPLNGTAASITISPQAANAGGNSSSGNVTVTLTQATGSGAEANFQVTDSALNVFAVKAKDGVTTSAYLYLSSISVSSLTTFTLFGDGTNVTLNTPSGGGTMSFAFANGAALKLTSSNIQPQIASFSWLSSVTSPVITQAAGGGAGTSLSITAQAGGGSSDGGALILGGGAHSGASQVDGSIQLTTPVNMGEVEFTPVNGANALTNAQSNGNILHLLAGASAGFTITYLRRIADPSLIFVRNDTSQTATIAYQSGGTVTVATATSALIASTGSNLVKILIGT